MLRRRFRTLLAAGLGLGLVGIPAALGIYWHVEVEPGIEQALAARLGRRVVVGSARPRWGGVRLSDVVVFGAPPFEKVPLLQAQALDVDVGFGSRAVRGLALHHARLAVVRDGEHGGDNVGDLADRLFRHSGGSSSGGGSGQPLPVTMDGSSLEIAYRDSGGARWVVRADGLDARVVGGAGAVHAGRLRIEVAQAAAEFEGTRFEVEGGHVTRASSPAGRLALAGAEDLIGGARLDAVHDAGTWRLRAQAAHLKVAGEVDAEGARVTVDTTRLPLAPLRPLGDPRGVGTAGATLDGHVALRFLPRRDALGIEGRVEVAGLTITNPRVTSEAISNAGVRVAGSLVASPRHGRFAVDQAVVRVGDLAFWVHGAVEGERGEADVRVDETPCQAALESLPPRLAPALEGAALAGVLSAHGKLRYDTAHLDDLQLDVDIKDRCVVMRDPPRADVTKLRQKDVPYRIEDEKGQSKDFPLGPSNPDWRSLSQISPHLVGAFLTAEDAGFWHHHGFEPEYIRRALIENLKKGRVVRGASTISQQLVKNLYLDKSRTFTRKLQEAALTWRMEQAVPKSRILELYLNMIELGPGIYGVRQASQRYFGKDPSKLTPLEAAHLASVAPNPKGYWNRFHRGPIGDDWTEKLYDLLGMMHRSHRLSDEDFAQAMSSRLRFED